jgi:hypothetical protein
MQFRSLRFLLWILFLACPHFARAQFELNMTAPSSVQVSNNINYTIAITNMGQGIQNLTVISAYSPSLVFQSATSNANAVMSRSGNTVQWIVQSFFAGTNVVLNLALRANQTMTVTNGAVATAGTFTSSDAVSTTVTAAPGTADVEVLITPPSGPVIVNDWIAFNVTLRNRGGGSVSGIFLTNTFTNNPVLVKGFSPSGSSLSNPTRVVFNIGTLAIGQTTNVSITVQPTAATNLVLTSRFRSSGNADTNSANDVASASVNVQLPGTNQLSATRVSNQIFNPQNAYMEQLVLVTNSGSNAAPSARVVFTNLNYKVANASGTNNGNPFVVHPATLQPTQSVELLIEYFIPEREPRPDPQFIAYSVGTVNAAASTTGTAIAITNIAWRKPFGVMAESNVVLYFPATRGRTYEIQYTSNATFSGALKALPPLVAQANAVQWIDYGPPKTISRPVLGPTIMTNFATNDIIITNEMYMTNEIDMSIMTNFSFMTNFGVVTMTTTTNSNMRFYRAIQLP